MTPKDSANLICNEVVFTYPVVIYTKRDFFLLDAINAKLAIFKSAGLINFWHNQYVDRKISRRNEENSPKVLHLKHLQGSFQILAIGYLFGFISFVFERLFFTF